MEPHIQYAKTEDGVNIAFWTLGEGKALVSTPPLGLSHLHLEWQFPELANWYHSLSERRMLIRADWRGSGLSDLTIPTLVFDASDHSHSGCDLASSIPGSNLVLLSPRGSSLATWTEEVAAAIDDFLAEGEVSEEGKALPQGTTIILFADIADSTGLTERLGDTAFRNRARKLDEALPIAIQGSDGVIVEGKLLGDGVLATFSSAKNAIEAAQRCRTAGEEVGLELHVGIHAGDVIREGNNIHGGAVNIASRIADASAPGEILVSDIVRGLARTSAGVAFEDRGEHELKGIPEPQRLFAVQEQS